MNSHPEQNLPANQLDFDLHGLVGIRLIEPGAADARGVSRQLGPIQKPLDRPPDLTVRFVEKLETSSPVRLLGLDEAGYTEEGFLVLRSKHKAKARVQIPFEKIGQPCEIVCERGLPAVPLLVSIINLTALAKGSLALHASAFQYRGKGVLSTGWSKGGKTEMLLAFMANGAEYIGDEWVYLSPDGKQMYGIPEAIRVWDWHLQELDHFKSRVKRSDQARLKAIKAGEVVAEWMAQSSLRKTPIGRAASRVKPVLSQQAYVDVPPDVLFGKTSDNLSGNVTDVFFVASQEAPGIRVEPLDPFKIAERMVFSLQYEYLRLVSYYLAFRFAFPHLRNGFLEDIERLQRERLLKILAGKKTHAVYHPYPVSLPALYEAVCPIL